MNKYVQKEYVDSYTHDFTRRGARIYGTPVCDAVYKYLNDVSKESRRKRVFSMYFAQDLDVFEVVSREGE